MSNCKYLRVKKEMDHQSYLCFTPLSLSEHYITDLFAVASFHSFSASCHASDSLHSTEMNVPFFLPSGAKFFIDDISRYF
jgi:hypothetical protein